MDLSNSQILKEFLHPNCRVCDAQFVHRMDWVNHIVGTSHLKKLAELKAAGKNLEDHESTTQGELFSLSIEIGQDEHPSNCITVRNLDWKIPLKDDLKALLRDDMDVPEGEIIIPQKYDETVAVGKMNWSLLSGWQQLNYRKCSFFLALRRGSYYNHCGILLQSL